MLKFILRFVGSMAFGLGLLLIVFLLLSPGIVENFSNSNEVVSLAIDDFLVDNGDELFEFFLGDMFDAIEVEEMQILCDEGLIEEGCELFEGNYTLFFESEDFLEQKGDIVDTIVDQLDVVVEPVDAFHQQRFGITVVMVCLLILGGVMMYFGVNKDWLVLLRKLFMRIGVTFLLAGLVMRYLVFKGTDVLLSWFSIDAPRIILELSLDIAFSFFESVFLVYWLPFVVVGGVSLAVVLGLWSGMIVRWRKKKKKS